MLDPSCARAAGDQSLIARSDVISTGNSVFIVAFDFELLMSGAGFRKRRDDGIKRRPVP